MQPCNRPEVAMYNTVMSHSRLTQILLFLLVLVPTMLGPVSVKGQSAASDSDALQARIDEAARALSDNPHLKQMPYKQVQATTEFVAGNLLFVLLHEFGHTLVSEMALPVLGREEDAADAFATLTMLKIGTDFSHRVLVEAAKGWFLSDLSDKQKGETIPYYDEHGLNEQRAYQIVCLMVGSAPDEFRDLA